MKETKEFCGRNYLQMYEFGHGIVGIQSGLIKLRDKKTLEETHTLPFIDISILMEKKDVGQELEMVTESTDFVKLFFSNIEGLDVLQRALDYCRKELELKMDNTTE